MAQFQTIGQGPGNLVPDSEIKSFRCGAAVTLGWGVALSGATAVTALGGDYTLGLVVEGCDTSAADTAGVVGYALESGSQGDWIKVVVGGYVPTVITDGSVAEGDHLIPTASPGIMGGTAGGTRDLIGFGVALDADSSTTLTGAYIRMGS